MISLTCAGILPFILPNVKNSLVSFGIVIGIGLAAATVQAGGMRPAMVGSGGNSFASQLHYPEKAKSARKQAAVTFYTEIGADGRASHFEVLSAKENGQFSDMVDHALRKSLFQPAMVDGKPVPVMLGGTVIFMFQGNQPAIVVSLSTADKEKTASLGNYIQPQMIGSSAELRRRILQHRFDNIFFRPGPKPSADVLAHVDVEGNLTGTKILAESPPDGGYGPLLVKGFQSAKFIPALNNGAPVAGDFNLPMDFRYLKNPDAGPGVGSQIKDDR